MKKIIFLILVLLSYMTLAISQECEGNLGENIFLDGDFGSGVANVLSPDPQIAPGYIYQFNPPPDDGFYTITNSTAPWGSFAANWDDIQDNSSDPNGYMMIVNASFDPGVFYEKEVVGLCDNTLYYFSVDVYNLINAINPNISFQLDGLTLFSSGTVPYNRQWNTYGFTFTTAPGQTELTLAILNNAPGGMGNDLALDNISFRACGPEALILPETVAQICEDGNPIVLEATVNGDQYPDLQIQWQESPDGFSNWTDIPGETTLTYTHTQLSTGSYFYRYLLANGVVNLQNNKCRVVSNIKEVEVVPKFYEVIDTICEGIEYLIDGSPVFSSGTYVDPLVSSIGCDSIVTIELTILPDPGIQLDLDPIDPSCSYLEDGSIGILNVANAVAPYQIIVNGEEVSETDPISNLAEGIYIFTVTDRYGCSTAQDIILSSPNPFTIEIGPDIQVSLGENIEVMPIYSESPSTVQWGNGAIIECDPDCSSLEFFPLESETLILTAISPTGCIATDSLQVSVDKVRNVFIPNIFSPNQDGANDRFVIYAAVPNVAAIERLHIYDRWGNLIYSRENILPNDPEAGWDGTIAGKMSLPGVYIYSADIRFLDGAVINYAGDITLSE